MLYSMAQKLSPQFQTFLGICSFVLIAILLFVFVSGRVLGPGDPNNKSKISIPTSSFNLGVPDPYKRIGVYSNFLSSREIFLVTNEHNMLVALAARCPNDNNLLKYDRDTNRFKCMQCSQRFTSNGLRLKPYIAPTSLARLRLRAESDDTVTVFPNRFFFHENPHRNTWSNPNSMFIFPSKFKSPLRK